MVGLKVAVAAAACVVSTAAVDITVKASGGNSTIHKGQPYGYGFLHEVSKPRVSIHQS